MPRIKVSRVLNTGKDQASFHVDSLATAQLDDDIESESVVEGTKAFAAR